MNKKSYSNSRLERRKMMDKLYINHQSDSATENAGRNAYNLQEMSVDINGNNPDKLYDKKYLNKYEPNEDTLLLLEELQGISNDLDLSTEADFFSFLIQKFAQSDKAKNNFTNASDRFNNLMIKISLTDIPDTNSLIKKLTKIYSTTIMLELERTNDLKEAKSRAYKKILHRTEQYFNNGKMIKSANLDNPIIVAHNIKNIVDTLVSQFSHEAKLRAYPNIKEKISLLNAAELAEKRSPGGAAIGTAINIIKNILKGRDSFFINSVLENLKMIL